MAEIWTALALLLVLEGILPFLVPARWKEAIRQIADLPDRQLRIMGLVSMLVGLALLTLVRTG